MTTIVQLDKLTLELQAALMPDFVGVDSNANVSWSQTPTAGELTTASNIIAAHDDTLPLGYVSCLTTGAKLCGAVGGSGQVFLPDRYRIAVRQITGLTTPPTASLGTNSPNYDNLQIATLLTGWAQGDMQNFLFTTKMQAVLALTFVYINVTIAAVATSYILWADFKGDYKSL